MKDYNCHEGDNPDYLFARLVDELRKCDEIEKMDFKFTFYEGDKEIHLNQEHFREGLAIGCKKVYKKITKEEVESIYVFGILNFN